MCARDFPRKSKRPLGMWEGWCQWILTVHILNYSWICLRSIPICDIFITDSQDSGMSRWASERFTVPRLIRCLMNCYVVWFKEKHTQYLADKSLFKPWMLTDVFSGIFFGLVEHFTHVLFVSHTHRLKKKNKKKKQRGRWQCEFNTFLSQ